MAPRLREETDGIHARHWYISRAALAEEDADEDPETN
jgi:hypothetical protein